ncbi:MAG: hypothetical protein LC785_10555 [Acidobacteria bacterium]|nr:hypothetical protein [Acidobacteriota bacterium]MCA1642367.1 hypothetical protein [Acidobacteriota bacterium]
MNRSVEEHLLNPPPGSAAARARDFGIDLTLTLQRLRLTPDERLRQLQQAMIEIETMRGHARRDAVADDQSRADPTTVDPTSS